MGALSGGTVAITKLLKHHDEVSKMVQEEPVSALLPAAIVASGVGIGALSGAAINSFEDYRDKRKQAKIEEQKRIMREVLKEKKKI